MLETKILPDFITVDGAEGGTGAAPLEFSDSVGTPLNDGLVFVHNSLVGVGLRDHIRLIAAGKITTGVHIAKKIALGADMCNSARGMLFALGCIQALRCNTNACPTGVATQDPELVKGLHVGDKAQRVANFHRETLKSFFDVLGAAGLSSPKDLKPWHIMRRIGPMEVRNYSEIYPFIEAESLLSKTVPPSFERPWSAAKADTFL
jgi:glutamate synthase domain-containing protein 2